MAHQLDRMLIRLLSSPLFRLSNNLLLKRSYVTRASTLRGLSVCRTTLPEQPYGTGSIEQPRGSAPSRPAEEAERPKEGEKLKTLKPVCLRCCRRGQCASSVQSERPRREEEITSSQMGRGTSQRTAARPSCGSNFFEREEFVCAIHGTTTRYYYANRGCDVGCW